MGDVIKQRGKAEQDRASEETNSRLNEPKHVQPGRAPDKMRQKRVKNEGALLNLEDII